MRKYNWKPDIPDFRDIIYKPKIVHLPEKVDLRWNMSPVEDQGNIGSCSGQAFAAILEYLDMIKDGKAVDVSRLFIYYVARDIEGSTSEDAGAYLRDNVKGMAKWGCPDESIWPYDPSNLTRHPSKEAYRDALKRKIKSYQRIENRLLGVKTALANGSPVAFGFSVYTPFENIGKDGYLRMPSHDDDFLGGHAVCAVGYDDEKECLIVRNSWGMAWGSSGYFFMPYGYITNSGLSDDFWIITDALEFTMEGVHIEPGWEVQSDWFLPIGAIWQFFKKIFGKGD